MIIIRRTMDVKRTRHKLVELFLAHNRANRVFGLKANIVFLCVIIYEETKIVYTE